MEPQVRYPLIITTPDPAILTLFGSRRLGLERPDSDWDFSATGSLQSRLLSLAEREDQRFSFHSGPHPRFGYYSRLLFRAADGNRATVTFGPKDWLMDTEARYTRALRLFTRQELIRLKRYWSGMPAGGAGFYYDIGVLTAADLAKRGLDHKALGKPRCAA